MTLKDIIHALNGLAHLPMWWAQRFHKRNPNLWTFGAWDGLRYSDNSRALYEYVLNNRKDIRAVWMTNSIDIYHRLCKEGKPVALCCSKEGKKIQMQAGFFFATKGGLDGAYRYMNGIQYINLWHGMPLKQIGRDAMLYKRKETGWKKFKTACRRILIPWEFLDGPTVSNAPFFAPFLQSAFGLSEENVWNVGSPRNMYLHTNTTEQLIDRLNRRFNHPVKILYLPTHRDNKHGIFNPFDCAGYNGEVLEKVLKNTNAVLLHKGHFYEMPLVEQNLGSIQPLATQARILHITDSDFDNLYTLIKDIDILLTDYSSVYFDFLYLRKPIILFPFDEQDYIVNSRLFYFDYSLMQAKRVYTWNELSACIEQRDYWAPSDEEVQRFAAYPIENTCQAIISKLISN